MQQLLAGTLQPRQAQATCTSHPTCLTAYESQNYCCVLCSTCPCWVQLIVAMALSALRSSPARLLKVLGPTATAQVKFKLVQRMVEAALKLVCAAAIAHLWSCQLT